MLSLNLLGNPQIVINQEPFTGLTSAKSQALLFYLALDGRPQSRLRLAGLLWPENSDQGALGNLRRSLYLLRQALPDVVKSNRTAVRLNEQIAMSVDVLEFESGINSGLAGDMGALQTAVDGYGGDFLSGFYIEEAPGYEEWLLTERERLHSLMVQGLDRLASHFAEHREIGQGILYTGKMLALEPLREASHRQMIQLLAWDGQIQAALAQYERCRQLLADELSLAPAEETTALWRQIQTGTLGRYAPLQPASEVPVTPRKILDWGDAPMLMPLYGRAAEIAQLETWLVKQQARLAAVLGLGGQGKTALAAVFARSRSDAFEAVLWRTLLNAPPLANILQFWLERLAPETAANMPGNLDGQLDLLFEHLSQKRCLFVLDNAESIMQSGQHAGAFRAGYEAYDHLLRRFALGDHLSCLLLTSREKPNQFTYLERRKNPVYSLALPGLATTAGQAILDEENIVGSESDMEALVQQYSGNPLALILIADTIHELYEGDVGRFLAAETAVFDTVQAVLAQQFDRLTELEALIMLWLAVEREVVTIPMLMELILIPHDLGELLTALRSLQRRSLIEKRGDGFTLQNVLLEFTTDYLVTAVITELREGRPKHFAQLPLLKAQAGSYIRRTQERLLLRPVARQLETQGGSRQAGLLLTKLLASLPPPVRHHSYCGGNILNLLLHYGLEDELDFSETAVWQGYLRGKILPPINFSGADLTGTAFTDYGGHILSLSFSPNGTFLAGSSATGELRLWDVARRQPLLTLDGHQDFASVICFSPDGRFLASGGADGLVCLWDSETGRRLHTFTTHNSAINDLVYALDGSWIASVSSFCLAIWDPNSGETLFCRRFEDSYLDSLALSHDGNILAIGNKGKILLWDVPASLEAGTGQLLFELQTSQNRVRKLLFSPDNTLLAAGGDEVSTWEVKTGALHKRFSTADSQIFGMAFHPENSHLAIGGKGVIYLWQVESGELVRAFHAHEQMVLSLVYSPDGRILASSSSDHIIRLWDGNGQILHTIQGYDNRIHTVDVSQDGRYVASGSEDKNVRLWDYSSGELLGVWAGHNTLVWRVAFSPDGRSLASCSRDKLIRVWNVPDGVEQYQLQTNALQYFALVYSQDGQWLATGGQGGEVSLWQAATGHRQQTFKHPATVCAIAFHPDGNHLAAVCFDRQIYIWEIAGGRRIRVLYGHENEVWALTYSRDGRFLVSASDDGTVRFWQSDTGECSHILTGHNGWIQAVAFNRAGNLLATGSQDKTIRVWDVAALVRNQKPQLVRTLTGHTARVMSLCFTPDDSTIISSSIDETIRFWWVATGTCFRTWLIPGPYTGMNINGATGITPAQRRALKALGAVEAVPE